MTASAAGHNALAPWRVDYAYGWQVPAKDWEVTSEDGSERLTVASRHGPLRWLRFDVPPDSVIRRVLLHRVAGVHALGAYVLALRISDGAATWRHTLPGRGLARMLSSEQPPWLRYLVPQAKPPRWPKLAEEIAFAGLEVLEVLIDCGDGTPDGGGVLGSPSHPTCTIAFESRRLDATDSSWRSSQCPMVQLPRDPLLRDVSIFATRRLT